MKKAVYSSEANPLIIWWVEIPCYVLDDWTRVITQYWIIKWIGLSWWWARDWSLRLVEFTNQTRIKPFMQGDILDRVGNPIEFTINNSKAYWYDATILAEICSAIVTARDQWKLLPQQAHIWEQCMILLKAFAQIWIIALVDEATWYQKDRPENDLQVKINAFISEEVQKRVKTFPNEFFDLLYKLEWIERSPTAKTHPTRFGRYIMHFVYDTMDEDVSNWLKINNPEPGKVSPLHHQRLTDFGHNKLLLHLMQIMGVMKMSRNIKGLRDNIHSLFPLSKGNENKRSYEALIEKTTMVPLFDLSELK